MNTFECFTTLPRRLAAAVFLLLALPAAGQLVNHGVASPVSSACGVVTTQNQAGEKIILAFLSDASGCPGLLLINVDRDTHTTVPVPDQSKNPDHRPMYTLLSSRNLYYSAFGGRFYEFDPEKQAFTFHSRTSGQIGMGMTEDDAGRIWTGSWPGGELCAFDPATRQLTDYGKLVKTDWQIYQRYLAADAAGWIYFGVGNVEAQIYAFNPESRDLRLIIPVAETRKAATGEVQRDRNGKVYGWLRAKDTPYFELSGGESRQLKEKPAVAAPAVAPTHGTQFLFDKEFPDGSELLKLDLLEKVAEVKNVSGETVSVAFHYPSMGTHVSSVAALPDGTIRGAAMHPMRYFIFDIARGEFAERGPATFQWNAVCADETHLWVGGYGGGGLIDWDTARPFESVSEKMNLTINPRTLGRAEPELHRPSDVKIMPGGRQVVMAGTPAYGRTGGGLAIFDRQTERFEVIPHEELFGEPAAQSLLPLSESLLLIGGTTTPGTGGRRAEGEASMMIYDIVKRKAVWQGHPVSGAANYLDLVRLPDGRVLGIVDRTNLFLFDVEKRQVLKEIPTGPLGSTSWHQAPRLLLSDGKRVFVLFADSIVEFLPAEDKLIKLVEVPEGITAGGAVYQGRIYFCSKSQLMSYGYLEE